MPYRYLCPAGLGGGSRQATGAEGSEIKLFSGLLRGESIAIAQFRIPQF